MGCAASSPEVVPDFAIRDPPASGVELHNLSNGAICGVFNESTGKVLAAPATRACTAASLAATQLSTLPAPHCRSNGRSGGITACGAYTIRPPAWWSGDPAGTAASTEPGTRPQQPSSGGSSVVMAFGACTIRQRGRWSGGRRRTGACTAYGTRRRRRLSGGHGCTTASGHWGVFNQPTRVAQRPLTTSACSTSPAAASSRGCATAPARHCATRCGTDGGRSGPSSPLRAASSRPRAAKPGASTRLCLWLGL